MRKFVEIISGVHSRSPVVEFGAYQVPGLEADLRGFFPGVRYVGCDVRRGDGVDVITDCRATPLTSRSVGTLLCCEMLEHCAEPSQAIAEAFRVLRDDGLLVITCPFLFGIHHMPDYWRFTPQGMDLLLKGTPHRAVYFKGDVWLPTVILAVASKSYEPLRRVELELDARLGELPADRPEEHVFRWSGEHNYIRTRSQFLKPIELKFNWVPQV